MNSTDTLDSGIFANQRTVASHTDKAWRRPARARSTSFDQPVSIALPDVTLRDSSWRQGDRGDLYALAALAAGFASVAALLAYMTA